MPSDRKYDGSDLLPFLKGSAVSPRKDFFYYVGDKIHGVREGHWKLRAPEGGKAELFHLDRDPAEMYAVLERYPEVAARLSARMKAMAVELASPGG